MNLQRKVVTCHLEKEGIPICVGRVPGLAQVLGEQEIKCPVLELDKLTEGLTYVTAQQLRQISPKTGGVIERIAVNEETGDFAAECGIDPQVLFEWSGIEADPDKIKYGYLLFHRVK